MKVQIISKTANYTIVFILNFRTIPRHVLDQYFSNCNSRSFEGHENLTEWYKYVYVGKRKSYVGTSTAVFKNYSIISNFIACSIGNACFSVKKNSNMYNYLFNGCTFFVWSMNWFLVILMLESWGKIESSTETVVIKLDDSLFVIRLSTRYLCLIFDSKLKWFAHIINVVTKCGKILNILRIITKYDEAQIISVQ